MKRNLWVITTLLAMVAAGCKGESDSKQNADQQFASFENDFLDAYWKQYPAASIFIGYGKYYDQLVIPDSAAIAANIRFSELWLDSLNRLDVNALGNNNKISLNIIKNRLQSNQWYQTVFREYEWNPSMYNLSGGCDYILNQPYAALDERLKILSKRLEHSDAYYKAALAILRQPTKEHTALAVKQNLGGLSILGPALTDSIHASNLTAAEKEVLQQRIAATATTIRWYADTLQSFLNDKNYVFRNFRIGKTLFAEKFKYDIATDLSPEQVYEKAMADKNNYHQKMFALSDKIWSKYYGTQTKPVDTIALVQMVMDKIQLQHTSPEHFYDSLTSQVYQLKKFIVEKDLFDFDTASPPIIVRLMPEYARGFTVANAEFTPPYQKKGATYYNIDDLTAYPPAKAEGVLREYNNYASQLLSIHEAVPGHCVQGIYNSKKSPDILRSVFQNGAMIEGWAVYTEDMMLENGWGNHSPEMELAYYKLKLRELSNVLIDYDMQCLNKPKAAIMDILVKECFQTEAQAEEKYHRATVSQVQLCSYYTGAIAIHKLRDDYRRKLGDRYRLKDFHETFLSFGSSPVKYISEMMLQ